MFGIKPRETAQATILADEGYSIARNSQRVALQRQKYIVEVHPEGGPAFRTETEAWVSWTDRPEVGDVLQVTYRQGGTKVKLAIKGDPRYDWDLLAAVNDAEQAAKRDAILNAPVSSAPSEPLTEAQREGAALEALQEKKRAEGKEP